MPGPAFAARKEVDDLRLGVPCGADAWIAEKEQELDFKLKRLGHQARTGKLAGIRMEDGVLIISQQRTKVPKTKVEAAKWLILDRMPQIDITDLLAEVNTWTGFAQWFTHLRTGDPVRPHPGAASSNPWRRDQSRRQAHGRRLGRGSARRQITRPRQKHIRPETYKAFLAAIIAAHLAHPFAKLWGNSTNIIIPETASSSAPVAGAPSAATSTLITAAIPAASSIPGSPTNTATSDILPMGATEDEAVYVLDGLYGTTRPRSKSTSITSTLAAPAIMSSVCLQSEQARRPSAARPQGLALCTLSTDADAGLGPQASHRRPHLMPPRSARAGTRRCASASRSRTASSCLDRSEAARRPCRKRTCCRAALREIGRIERTLFMIEWYSSPELRDRCRAGLNKGEAGNKLTRAVFFHERGEIRDGSFGEPGFPRFRPQSGGQCHRLVEHRLSLARRRGLAGRRARPAR